MATRSVEVAGKPENCGYTAQINQWKTEKMAFGRPSTRLFLDHPKGWPTYARVYCLEQSRFKGRGASRCRLLLLWPHF